MLKSLFPEYVKKWFAPLIKQVAETINGSVEKPKYLFKAMLKETYSPDLKWGSLSSNGSVVAADIVSMDTSLPLKKRDSMGKATGDIPKSGMKLVLTEKQLSDIDIMKAKGGKEAEVVRKIFADVKRVIGGVEERIEYMFLTGLSNGVLVVPSEETTGTGIRADFGHPDAQKFGVKVKWTDSNAKVLDDIENVISKAEAKGRTLAHMFLDGATFNIIRKSAQVRSLYASDLQISDVSNVPVPSKKKVRELILDEYGLSIQVIDRAVVLEKNGKRNPVKPWAAGSVAFLTSMEAGELQYGTLAEENHPVEGVSYSKANSYTLVSKYHKNDPVREFTTSQALVIPVIDVDNLFLMDTNEAQVVDELETEGDANITIWGQSLVKADVISGMETIKRPVSADITDANLIKAINELSDAKEADLKKILEVS